MECVFCGEELDESENQGDSTNPCCNDCAQVVEQSNIDLDDD